MTPMREWFSAVPHLQMWILLIFVLVCALAITSVAVARVDQFGGALVVRPYAPYTAGPVVGEETIEPYAPYTAGPVVPETETRPYAPYTAGPVVREMNKRAYAPYTAGPVVRESRPYAPYTAGPVVGEAETHNNIGHWMVK